MNLYQLILTGGVKRTPTTSFIWAENMEKAKSGFEESIVDLDKEEYDVELVWALNEDARYRGYVTDGEMENE